MPQNYAEQHKKPLYLYCVFHGIRFKVSNEDWLS